MERTEAASPLSAGLLRDGLVGGGEMRSRPPTQRDRQKAATRRRLLDAATEVYIERSPTTASLEEVAARGGVRRQTLVYHFGNRTGLWNAVLLHHLEAFWSEVREFRGELRSAVRAYLDAQRRPVVRLARQLDELLTDERGFPPNDYWYPALVANYEQRLVDAGISSQTACKRAPVLVLAMTTMARRVAMEQASEEEIADFVDTMCGLVESGC